MKTVLMWVFTVIDLSFLAYIVKLRLDDLESYSDAMKYVILPWLGVSYLWLYLVEESQERRQTMRRILGLQIALVGLIIVEWWLFKKIA